ncbi:6-phospho-3-hexuloisomerase [Neobacillus notoginsengisoli]|uniref:6-phospho-3-hexuloisomerase n=1 Tax=Neobacillus notoginsengisoli TaxID=1578198 RepID=A0A417YT34_9BACI|nr:6-phospho-3-hexuloisomerase [Neobacillus notoginsengisoli]RHW39106.1 6-phospho-3-hexuloisomerase [Neobacillus notoginsengisoli]
MNLLDSILKEINEVVSKVDEQSLAEAAAHLAKDKRIFVVGEGRSGLMAKGFAMRLMHLGYEVYVVGETITPAIKEKDVVVAVSGSGKSANVVSDAKKAKEKGATVLAFTSNLESDLARSADMSVVVPGTVRGDEGDNRKSIQLLSSLFDQSVHIVLDGLCLYLSRRDGISNESATGKHW